MKTTLSMLFLWVFSFSFSQVNWMTMEQALTAQKTNPKKILIDFYADWCGPCKLMDKQTYSHPIISKYINENFYAVKFNAEGNQTVNFYDRVFTNPDYATKAKSKNAMHQFAKFMNVNGYPALVFLDENAQPITNLMGFFSAKELEPYITLFSKGEYKNIKTREQWENYQKKFKSKIKE